MIPSPNKLENNNSYSMFTYYVMTWAWVSYKEMKLWASQKCETRGIKVNLNTNGKIFVLISLAFYCIKYCPNMSLLNVHENDLPPMPKHVLFFLLLFFANAEWQSGDIVLDGKEMHWIPKQDVERDPSDCSRNIPITICCLCEKQITGFMRELWVSQNKGQHSDLGYKDVLCADIRGSTHALTVGLCRLFLEWKKLVKELWLLIWFRSRLLHQQKLCFLCFLYFGLIVQSIFLGIL